MADRQKDFVSKRLSFFLLWVLPAAAMFAVANAGANDTQVTLVWVASLLVMSAGCFVNAIRSGRLHCALTGPLSGSRAASLSSPRPRGRRRSSTSCPSPSPGTTSFGRD